MYLQKQSDGDLRDPEKPNPKTPVALGGGYSHMVTETLSMTVSC